MQIRPPTYYIQAYYTCFAVEFPEDISGKNIVHQARQRSYAHWKCVLDARLWYNPDNRPEIRYDWSGYWAVPCVSLLQPQTSQVSEALTFTRQYIDLQKKKGLPTKWPPRTEGFISNLKSSSMYSVMFLSTRKLELIHYRYSSRCSYFLVLETTVVWNRIGMNFGRIVLQVNTHQLTESAFWHDVTLSRWQP